VERGKEWVLSSYEAMRKRGGFSEQLLCKVLGGLSGRQYEGTVVQAAEAFGVSPSAVSRRLVEATAKRLQEFQGRNLDDFHPFAIFLDTIHRAGQAFIVAVGIDPGGQKRVLGFWEGASENHEVARGLLDDMEERGCG
jgi:transposase-like protein